MKLFEADNIANIIEPMLKDAKGLAGYALSKDLRLIRNELKEFYDKRNELIRKYGTVDEKTGNIMVQRDNENYESFINELNIFADEEVDINFRMLKEDDLIESGLNGEQMYLLQNCKYIVK